MSRITPDLLADRQADLTAIRRDIHRHPETGFEETRTAQIVADKLQAWGIEVHRGLATTGVVGTLKGRRPGQKTIGLRADMDALHLQEKNAFAHASVSGASIGAPAYASLRTDETSVRASSGACVSSQNKVGIR